jgi:hypothetical protein
VVIKWKSIYLTKITQLASNKRSIRGNPSSLHNSRTGLKANPQWKEGMVILHGRTQIGSTRVEFATGAGALVVGFHVVGLLVGVRVVGVAEVGIEVVGLDVNSNM